MTTYLFDNLAKNLAEKFEINASIPKVKSFIMNYFDEVTTVYRTKEIVKNIDDELKEYYSNWEKEGYSNWEDEKEKQEGKL